MASITQAITPGLWFQTEDAWQWLVLAVALAPLPAGLLAVRRHGLERLTGMPAWAGSAVLLASWALVVAFFGFMWDVTWHADLGRDVELFTVPHALILAGLAGIGAAFLAAVGLATRAGGPGLRVGGLRMPVSAAPLGLLAAGALAGFPLDDYWHAVYGIDVTMWGPTHLLMIGAASLTPIAVWLVFREAGVHDARGPARRLWLSMPATVLVGLSTFQLEFDLGILQWQPLYQPLLIAAAMAIALTAARVAVGRGGALLAAGGFLAMRLLVAGVLTVGFGRGFAHVPLTLAEAMCVEAAFLLPRLPVAARAVAGGLLVATAGLAAEAAWTHLWYAVPWTADLLQYWWLDVVAAVAGALVGAAMGNVAAGRRAGLPPLAAAGALAALGVVLALHLPLRHAEPATVTLTATPAGPAHLETTRLGLTLPEQPVWLRVTLSPAAAADGADWFGAVAWQGGAPVQHAALVREAPGTYRSAAPVPAGGGWKTLVMVYRGDLLEATPVAMPPDFQYGLAQVPAPPAPRAAAFVPASDLLMREAHGGPPWPAAIIVGFFALMAVAWTAALAVAYARVGAGGPRPGDDAAAPASGGGRRRRPRVVIVGSGFSGLGMAIRLKRAGVDDFLVLEKASDLGGTWRDNRYPGCACDIPSHLYSFSFAPSPGWTRRFPPAGEIWAYMRRCAERFGVLPHVRFRTEMTGAELDPAGDGWRVHTRDGETIECQALVLAMGPLHQPLYPDVPGLERFAGPSFHSSRWEQGCDLAGKRVAVVGTGASAIQLVPEVAQRAAALHVFQRTPPWVLPRGDRPVAAWQQRLFRLLPATQRLLRSAIYWSLELRVLGFSGDPRLLRLLQRVALRHLRRQVPDPELRRALTPAYTLGCKRILLSDDYYPAFSRPNVELVTSAIAEVREDRIVTADGVERPVDVIVFGTGFHVTDAMEQIPVVGRDGLRIQDAWRDGVEAYLGTAVAGFPNLFLILGPNTGLGHNSMVFMIEAQTRYVLRCLRLLRDGRTASLEVRQAAQRAFNRRLQERLRRAVWSVGGCASWYLDRTGTNRTLWPGSSFRYWLRTRRPRTADYAVDAR